jgi:hypothetical protein
MVLERSGHNVGGPYLFAELMKIDESIAFLI